MTKSQRLLAGAACLAGLITGVAFAQTDPPAPVAPPGPVAPPASDTAKGAAAWDRLKGNTISGKAGADTFAEYFEPGGGVRYVDKDGASSGTWAVQGDKVCFDFPDDDDRSCSTFTVAGSAGTSVDDDGVTARFTIETGNAKGL